MLGLDKLANSPGVGLSPQLAGRLRGENRASTVTLHVMWARGARKQTGSGKRRAEYAKLSKKSIVFKKNVIDTKIGFRGI